MIIGFPKETLDGEQRVSLVPESIAKLVKAGYEVRFEAGAGLEAGFYDEDYEKKGATSVADVSKIWADSDIILKVNAPSAEEAKSIKESAVLIGTIWTHLHEEELKILAEKKVSTFAMERMPRITRAQSMDVLSSMSSLAGYKCVIVAADRLRKIFPMMMTAAGTITPATVFVLGAGVAGLQAIATAHRLGARVESFDVRAAVKEQVESLGAKFVEFDLGAEDAEDEGGYAKELTDEQKARQQELLNEYIAKVDVVITTALIPGRPAPKLVTEKGVRGMSPGSVIVDLAAEQGGNCELSEPGKDVIVDGVTIVGMANVASQTAYHASQMYSRNLTTFIMHLNNEEKIEIDLEDEVTKGPLVTHEGKVLI
ncbi:MAG: Re/Si-specific NAD(P)(+) transhydrogenase subunit alpha [Candidatus Lindowbacteria bacterium]|nr:Re/Si-specific NAD(P)(+) transhydrogenase subunit alpha [Candidatus Lindowbacteria bacterium]